MKIETLPIDTIEPLTPEVKSALTEAVQIIESSISAWFKDKQQSPIDCRAKLKPSGKIIADQASGKLQCDLPGISSIRSNKDGQVVHDYLNQDDWYLVNPCIYFSGLIGSLSDFINCVTRPMGNPAVIIEKYKTIKASLGLMLYLEMTKEVQQLYNLAKEILGTNFIR